MRRLTALTAAAAAAFLWSGCLATSSDAPAPHRAPGTAPSARSSAVSPAAPTDRRVERLLDRVQVVAGTTYHPGYDRGCDAGQACVFGPLWTDDHQGPFGHNGCDTRQDVLLQQLRRIELRWGSDCRLYDGVLVDPYTGERLSWREDGSAIQIDHVYPLAAAWYAGAWQWPAKRRVRFANDVRRELLAVSGRANQDKGAGTPATWLPPDRGSRCGYVRRYLRVAIAYDLPITEADAAAIRRVAQRC